MTSAERLAGGPARAGQPRGTRLAATVSIALIAFAANSVLARLALVSGETEALAYTGVRLVSGAGVLWGLRYLQRNRSDPSAGRIDGSWKGAVALLGYALPFSLAYVMLETGAGALLLFASVQISMLAWAIAKGDRPGIIEWLGLAVAFLGLIFLVAPNVAAPDPLGAALMVLAGVSWAVYSLIGRGSVSPLADTAGNFIRCLPAGLALVLLGCLAEVPSLGGFAYAVASGAVASGLGYAIWYAALPGLSRAHAAMVQLAVPAIAAVGGIVFLAEPLTMRLALASVAILGGMALALNAARWRARDTRSRAG